MHIGDKCKRRVKLGYKFINDPDYHGHRSIGLMTFDKTFKLLYCIELQNPIGAWNNYIGENVCALQHYNGWWHTADQPQIYDFDPQKIQLRTVIYTHDMTCLNFREDWDIWVGC